MSRSTPHRDHRRLAAAAIAVLAGLPIMLGALGVRVRQEFSEEHQLRIAIRSTAQHRAALRDVYATLLQAESAQRGFLLTGRVAYLGPYLHAETDLPGRLKTLARVSTDSAGRTEAARLQALSREKLRELRATVDLAQAGRRPAALALVNTDVGQRAMDRIRDLIALGRARDDGAIARGNADADLAESRTARAAIAIVALVMLTLLVATWTVVLSFRARRAALHGALDSEARYRLVTENATDMIVKVDPGGHLLFVSPASLALLGYSPEELLGRNIFELFHPDDAPFLSGRSDDYVTAVQRSPAPTAACRLLRKDGETIWCEGRPKLVFDEDGRPNAAFDVLRDVTQRREMELQLEQARREALAASEAKGEFLANMSHELRTPLTAILGYGRLMAEDPALRPETRRHLGNVRNAGEALLATVNDVLDFSKLEAGHLQICASPTDVPELVEATTGIVAEQARTKDLELELDISGPAVPVMIDGSRLRQVLLNLLANAIKFTDNGSVRLEVRHADDRLTARVTDTGIGIAPDKLELLFQRFSQVDGSNTRRHGGSGLGLAISRSLVEAMGGRIGVESWEGRGTSFWFDIAAPLAPGFSAVVNGEAGAPAAASGLRVLVADDTLVIRELVAAILRPVGCDVATAVSGEEALEMAATTIFDVILLDRHMPDLEGVEVARRLRALESPNAASLILAFSADVLAQQEAVFDGAVPKPFSPDELKAAVLRERSTPFTDASEKISSSLK